MPSTKKKKYWYVTYIDECPVCGSGDTYRERVYEKPKSSIVFSQSYDWCLEYGFGGYG